MTDDHTEYGAVLLLALHIPRCDGTEDADMIADTLVAIINEERDRNWPGRDHVVTVHLWPQWLDAQALGFLRAAIKAYRIHGNDAVLAALARLDGGDGG